MHSWSFDLAVDQDLTDPEGSDALFEAFEGDVTPCMRAGVPYVMCHAEGPDLARAVRSTIERIEAMGLGVRVVHVQVEAQDFTGGA